MITNDLKKSWRLTRQILKQWKCQTKCQVLGIELNRGRGTSRKDGWLTPMSSFNIGQGGINSGPGGHGVPELVRTDGPGGH